MRTRLLAGAAPDDSYSTLRARSAAQTAAACSTTSSGPRERDQPTNRLQQIEKLNELALAIGYTIVPIRSVAQAIGTAFARRTRSRVGNAVYQTASFSMAAVSCQAAKQLFTEQLLKQQVDNVGQMFWMATTVKEVRDLVGPIMVQSGYVCEGATRALKTESERWSRVVAHIIPQTQVIHVSQRNQLLIDFQYVLLDETGEMHPPKDHNRNEMKLSRVVEMEARAQIVLDLLELVARKQVQLSPTFLRQLGLDQEAMRLEAETMQLQQQQFPTRRRRVPEWEVKMIVEERGSVRTREYLVEWEGYHPSWEAWRVNGPGGPIGSPLQTWEPAQALMGTEALENWLEHREDGGSDQ